MLSKELYNSYFQNLPQKNNAAQRKRRIFLMSRDRNCTAKSAWNGFSPFLRASFCKLPNQVRQDGGGKVWNKSRNAEYFCRSQKTKLFSAGEKGFIKIDSRGWCYIFLLGFHYSVRRAKDTSGKNCLARAWQLNLFPVFSISWFTYSMSVLTLVAPPSRHWLRKHLSAFPHHRKWLQIKGSLNQEAVKACWKQSLAEQQAELGAQWSRDQSMHLTICQPPFLASH